MHPGKLIESNLVEMLSVKQLHLKAPMMKLQTGEICHFPSCHQHSPQCPVTMVPGPLPIWHNVHRAWTLTPTSIHPGRLAVGLCKGEKCIALSLKHNMEKNLRMDPREILNMILNLLMMLLLFK